MTPTAADASSAPSAAADTVARLAAALQGCPVPRVRALHLPPVPWNRTKDGEFGAIELDDGSLGVSYVLLDGTLAELAARHPRGDALAGDDALAWARRWADPSAAPAQRTIGYAAVNALARHLNDRAGYVPPAATDSIGGLDPQPGETIGMVGYFPPLVKQVIARGARLVVVELRADLAGAHDGFHVTLDPAALRDCHAVLMTSTVLLNDTLDALLAHCRSARSVVMVGPGASCLPDPLFERGVTALAGVWIADCAGFVQALRAGAPWGDHARKVLVRCDDAARPRWVRSS